MPEGKTTKAVRAFLKEVNDEIVTGRAAERSYYPAVERLVEAFAPNINAQIEQAGEASTPDFGVERRKNRIGVIEVKEPRVSLAEIERAAAAGRADHNAEQFNRYLREYDNLLYTNLLEWRRYRHHAAEPVQTAVIATLGADGKLHLSRDGLDDFERLIGAYLDAKPEPETTAKGLALKMARLTKVLDVNTQKALAEGDPYLQGLFDVFQKELIHGLKADEFADMYAQTVAYGLFTARMLPGGEGDFNRRVAGELLPKTNPFLRRVFKSLVDADNMPSALVWIVEDLAQLIEAAETGAIGAELARFGERRRKGEEVVEHDPIIYFYEHFLRAYDPKKAKQRGVYYTPLPVVSYIVRSIDELLKSEFDMPHGLADENVVILDPACGTGTFLYEVVRVIHERMQGRGPAYWKNEYVPGLLKRLFGFELLMAPYTIAHLKLAEQLRDTGYEFAEGQRLGIYLTNTLAGIPEHEKQTSSFGLMRLITEEKKEADKIKGKKPVMVVLGNPPYSGHTGNKGFWEDELKKGYELPDGTWRCGYYEVDGTQLGERTPKWIQNDYVKFLRWAQWRIEKTGSGIVGMITDNSYLDSPTFRGMRQNLITSFELLYVCDLHGNTKKKERAPDGGKDDNVFDITQGVAIGLYAKGAKSNGVFHKDIYGVRSGKYEVLASTDIAVNNYTKIEPAKPYYLFRPSDTEAEEEYRNGFKIPELFPINGVGMTTARDGCVIAWPDAIAELAKRASYFRDSNDSNKAVCEYLGIPMKKGWDISRAREKAKDVKNPLDFIVPVLYRPFDNRRIFYHDSLVWRTVKKVMLNVLASDNLGLITSRQASISGLLPVLVTDCIIDAHVITDAVSISYIYPLYLYENINERFFEAGTRYPNLAPEFAHKFLSAVGAKDLENSPEVGMRSGSREVLYPEDIFYYIYGVLHSPTYRTRYAEFLKIDFPRIPLPKDYESFYKLAAAGEKLAALHLLKDKPNWDWRGIGQRPGGGTDATVGKVEYDEKNEDVIFDAKKPAKEQVRVGPVPRHVWEFHVGGYQVLQKWLKDRKGRPVDLGDYVPIIVALAETERIMKEEIDPVFRVMLGIP